VREGNPFILALALTFLFFISNAFIALNTPGYSRFDEFTESLIHDSAIGYVSHGFVHDAGLPVISDQWIKANFPHGRIADTEHIYLHSPCLPYWLAGLGVRLFGASDVRWLRVIPVAINSLLLFVFFQGVFSVLTDRRRQLWFIICFTAIPMGWVMLSDFSPNAYAHYILLALVGVLLPLFHAGQPASSRSHFAVAGFYGFLAACFTWDYFFVMLMAPLAVACLYHGERILRDNELQRLAFNLSAFVAAGFALAQSLHLLEVTAYYGSISHAVTELANVGRYRATGNAAGYHFLTGLTVNKPCSYCNYILKLGPLSGRLVLAWHYLISLTASDFGGQPVLVLPVVAYLIAGAVLAGVCSDRNILYRFLALALVSMVACFLWPMIMEDHGVAHTRLIARHFYVVYILLALLVIDGISGHLKAKDAARPF